MDILKKFSKKKLTMAAVAGLVVISFLAFRLLQAPEKEMENEWANTSQTKEVEEADTTAQTEFFADVKGEVMNPGVYPFEKGDRVGKLIESAGGLTENADANQVNLAAVAEDAMVIYVPAKAASDSSGQALTDGSGGTNSANSDTIPADNGGTVPNNNASVASGGSTANESKINLNTATKEELESVNGIGPSLADAILQYRTENGRFGKIEDLNEVSGIGDKTYEKLKDYFYVA